MAGASSFPRAVGTLVAKHNHGVEVVLAGVVAVAPVLAVAMPPVDRVVRRARD